MATSQDTTKDPAAKRAALSLIAKGLITKAEAARLAGVSKQLMQIWCTDIPVDRNRDAVLTKLWRAEIKRKR